MVNNFDHHLDGAQLRSSFRWWHLAISSEILALSCIKSRTQNVFWLLFLQHIQWSSNKQGSKKRVVYYVFIGINAQNWQKHPKSEKLPVADDIYRTPSVKTSHRINNRHVRSGECQIKWKGKRDPSEKVKLWPFHPLPPSFHSSLLAPIQSCLPKQNNKTPDTCLPCSAEK